VSSVTYQSVHPIGDTDPMALPVADVERAVPYYESRLGFQVESRQEAPVKTVVLARDQIRIALSENGGDPEQASCYMEVSDVGQAREELAAAGVNPSELRTDQYGGNTYRVFFVRDNDGLCYCIGQQQS
jgi:lactoylglutathione lyase